MIDGTIDDNPIGLSFMVNECERLAWGEAKGELGKDPIGPYSMASECERPRKRGSVPTGNIAVE